MNSDVRREPVLNAPAIVVWLIAVMVLIHLFTSVLDRRQLEDLLINFAYVPLRYSPRGAELPGASWAAWVAPMSHMFLHASWLHLLVNCAWLLAFGSIIARRMNTARFLVFFILCGLGGVALFQLVNSGVFALMVGASGAVSGLMGAVFRFLFHARELGGFGSLHAAPRNVPLMPLGQALTNGRVLAAVGIWFGINALFATDVASMLSEDAIAWEAHIGGFVVGFLVIGLFDQVDDDPPFASGFDQARF